MKRKLISKILGYIRGGKPSLKKELEILKEAHLIQMKENVRLRMQKKDLEDQVKQLTEQLIAISQVNKWVY